MSKKIKNRNKLTYAEAILQAHDLCLEAFPENYIMGLGVPDPKGIFGTTIGLKEKYGTKRVFDIPLSENALTGVALGGAITGMRPVLTHQRVDFALVSLEQIINQVAKWNYMFANTMQASMLIRMIIGRGWGQGPQHSQSLQSLFAQIPGLKVIMPSNPRDAKGLIISAIEDNGPVISIEHRWCYALTDFVDGGYYKVDLGKARVSKKGNDITIVSMSYAVIETMKAATILEKYGISVEVIDLRTVSPIDFETCIKSVKKTKRLLVCDQGPKNFGVSSELVVNITENLFNDLICAPLSIGDPFSPVPTSHNLIKDFYLDSRKIANQVMKMLGRDEIVFKTSSQKFFDQPDKNFTGPF
jgi:pyruvate/2-oxoglutarate/acetoin dehydrogenase E1 component